MFDKMRPNIVGIVNADEWDSEAQIVGMILEEEGVLKMEFKVDGTEIELFVKLGHMQVALNEMIQTQNILAKKEQLKSQISA